MPVKGEINFEFDEEAQEYYIVWEPVIIGMGPTKQAAGEDLRTVAHFYIDTLIDLALKDID
jgi:hypothetical protein